VFPSRSERPEKEREKQTEAESEIEIESKKEIERERKRGMVGGRRGYVWRKVVNFEKGQLSRC